MPYADGMTRTPPPRRPRWPAALAIVLGLTIALLALGQRWLQTMPVCTGETKASPDGRYTASAFDCTETGFFTGETRHWFEFRIAGPGLDYRQTGTPLPGPDFGSRSSGSVTAWEPDSSAVRFAFPAAALRFQVGKLARGMAGP